jgi:hypothetical protein
MSPTLNASLKLVLFWPSLLCPLPVQGNPSTGRQIPPHEQYVVPAQAQPPPPPPHGQAEDVLQSHCEHTHCLTSYAQSTGSLTGGGGAAPQYLSACPPQVDVTPGTAAAQTRQSPTLATLALAQRKAKQPSQSEMTSRTTPLITRVAASQAPPATQGTNEQTTAAMAMRSILLGLYILL